LHRNREQEVQREMESEKDMKERRFPRPQKEADDQIEDADRKRSAEQKAPMKTEQRDGLPGGNLQKGGEEDPTIAERRQCSRDPGGRPSGRAQ
jgi:hypothetical protein